MDSLENKIIEKFIYKIENKNKKILKGKQSVLL
jgi:hypothetical protein